MDSPPVWVAFFERSHRDQGHDDPSASAPLLSHHRHATWLPIIHNSGKIHRLWTSTRTTSLRRQIIDNSHYRNRPTLTQTGLKDQTRAINELLAVLSTQLFNPLQHTPYNLIPTALPLGPLFRYNINNSTFPTPLLLQMPTYHRASLGIHFCSPARDIIGEAAGFPLNNIRRSATRLSHKYPPHQRCTTLEDNYIATRVSRFLMSAQKVARATYLGAVRCTQGYLLKMGASVGLARVTL